MNRKNGAKHQNMEKNRKNRNKQERIKIGYYMERNKERKNQKGKVINEQERQERNS